MTVEVQFQASLNSVTDVGGGHDVAQLVEALRYKSECRGFDSQWRHNLSGRTRAPGSTQVNGGKGGRCVRLTTLPSSCAVVIKSGNLNFLESSGPLQACNGTALPLPLYSPVCSIYLSLMSHCLHSGVSVQKGKGKGTGKSGPRCPEGSRKLRFPDYVTTAQDGGKVVSLTHRPPFYPQKMHLVLISVRG